MNVSRHWIQLLCAVLLIPALLINLGLMTVIDDEGIRSLVALEMLFSNDFITPTWHGEFYYKKPPLFNWVLAIFFSVFGSAEEWVARLPTVLALLGYGGTIFYFFRKHYSPRESFLYAFVFITCGRILFWDSMLALIDISFSWIVFTCFMGSYYFLYYLQNPSLDQLFSTLLFESSKRTVIEHSIGETLTHIVSFPFEMIYHFLPWSLMIIYCLRKDVLTLLRKDPFISYTGLIFMANVWIYWVSPQVFPRYLLMLAPLIFSVFIYLHRTHHAENSWQYRIILFAFGTVMVIAPLCSLAPLFLDRSQSIGLLVPKVIFLFVLLSGTGYLYLQGRFRLEAVVAMLLISRIGFDWFILPDRNQNDFGAICRSTTIEVARQTQAMDLYVYDYTEMQATNTYYLERTRGKTVPVARDSFPVEALYIIDPIRYPELKYEKIADFELRHERHTFDIGKLVVSEDDVEKDTK
jgi:hypothetical protein